MHGTSFYDSFIFAGACGMADKAAFPAGGQQANGLRSRAKTISSRAYVTQMATRYLEKPLTAYPDYLTPCARDLVEAYDEAREKVDVLDDAAKTRYASKCGAAIFAQARVLGSTHCTCWACAHAVSHSPRSE